MADIEKLLRQMRQQPANTRFADLEKVCTHFFGEPRHKGGSHLIYKMPWPGDPRINIQNQNGKAKSYQVTQVLEAIQKLKSVNDEP